MFYSQTLLAQKGALGTVWCAAHAQHRLKKSQYTATDIPKTVDLIMYPEAPLALRMSGHLLLGVVRIYSKKVDYLHHDLNLLNTMIRKAFLSFQVNLPEDSRHAPVESVTLPQALNLDEFDLEDDTFEREFNNHRLSEEDITLTDQNPTGVDPYVAVTFDEDIIPEFSPMDVDQFTVAVSEHTERMDIDMVHEAGPDNEPRDYNIALNVGTDSPRNLTEEPNLNTETSHPSSPGRVPESFEKRRSLASTESQAEGSGLIPSPHPSSAAEQQSVRVERTESSDDTLHEKEITIPNIHEDILSSRRHLASPTFAGSEDERGVVHPSPHLFALQPSSPQPQIRPRKRMRFDKVTVFTNRIMKERLEDPSDTLCKRKKMPSSKVGFWRMNNQSKKDQYFNEPLFTGLSDDLRNVYEKDYVASKPYLAVSDETLPEPPSVSSPVPHSVAPDSTNVDGTGQVSPVQQTDDVQDIAGPRPAHAEPVATETQTPQTSASSPTQETETGIHPTTPIPHSIPDSPVQETDDVQDIAEPQPAHAEPVATETQTPQTPYTDVRVEHERVGGHPVSTTPPPARSSPSKIDDFTTQPGTWDKTEPSASTIPEDQPEQRDLELSPIPDMAEEEFSFLEVGGDTPDRSPASQDSDALSGRTRALAQYLKNRSSSSPTSSHPSGDLSLNEMLTGKTRKLAARMFFETLVLKSRGLIDMHQDQPYGDIALKLMPSLFTKVQT